MPRKRAIRAASAAASLEFRYEFPAEKYAFVWSQNHPKNYVPSNRRRDPAGKVAPAKRVDRRSKFARSGHSWPEYRAVPRLLYPVKNREVQLFFESLREGSTPLSAADANCSTDQTL